MELIIVKGIKGKRDKTHREVCLKFYGEASLRYNSHVQFKILAHFSKRVGMHSYDSFVEKEIKSRMTSTYGIIWDLDGTIVDTMPIHYRAWVKFMLDKGVNFTEEAFRASSGKPASEIMQDYFPDASSEELHQMADVKDGYYRDEATRSGLQLLPGVVALLEGLQALGFKHGIGSGAPRQNLELFYQLNPQVKSYFLAEVVAGETANTKPHPEVFLKVAELIEVDPQKCIVIEDGTLGIEAATRGGMPSIAVTTTGHSAASFMERGATLVVDSLEEVSVEDIKRLLGANF